MNMEFFATCSRGMEKVLGDELRQVGVHGVRPLNGGVSFSGDIRDAYRALLWSRVASRVILNIARIDASDADTLYEGVKTIAWENHVSPKGTIAVDARGTNNKLRDTRFTALRIKDAVCDRLRELRGERPSVDVKNPHVRINASIRQNKATLSIDLSGPSLDRRDYMSAAKPQGAPIRTNLAAGMLLLAGWRDMAKAGAAMLNPFSGSGTVAVEAAMIAANIAPQIYRSDWGFTRWMGHDDAIWQDELDNADERAENGIERCSAQLLAWDSDIPAIEYTRACAKKAGVGRLLDIRCADPTAMLDSEAARSLMICNLTGDGRFASLAQMPALYAQIASNIYNTPSIESVAVLAQDSYIDASFGLPLEHEFSVRNGASEASVRVYAAGKRALNPESAQEQGDRDVNPGSDAFAAQQSVVIQAAGKSIAVGDRGVEQFAARLGKVYKQRRKWAKKEGISAYRLYDADLPDYNLAVDVYCGAGRDEGKMYVHVAEYAAPKKIDPAKAARRMNDALAVIPAVLDVSPRDVFAKQRLRAKGGSQYARQKHEAPGTGRKLITQENGLFFEVDLADRLDTGLFLDHRDTRALLRKLAPGKAFLNLFAYTGTASVYAAAGGAKFTTTVDMSNSYQEWTRRNFELNGLANEHMELERADVLAWVQEQRHTRNRWDLIFVDPPTFSNSAKMGKRTWSVQDDHAELLIGVSRLLTRTGAMVFSCNLRDFKPDVEKLNKAGVVINEITDRTIPDDFKRNMKIHHCYVLRRG